MFDRNLAGCGRSISIHSKIKERSSVFALIGLIMASNNVITILAVVVALLAVASAVLGFIAQATKLNNVSMHACNAWVKMKSMHLYIYFRSPQSSIIYHA
jgi:uncharacterized protein (DUF362 family)